MPAAVLGRGWSDEELAAWLDTAAWPYERPASIADAIAAELAADRIVAWFQGRSDSVPGRWAAARCWPTRAAGSTWTG